MLSPLLQVVTRAKLSEVNIEVEKLKNNIEKQENVNESVEMQINELASLDKIREIAKENGLSYKNNNITSIDKDEDNTHQRLAPRTFALQLLARGRTCRHAKADDKDCGGREA